MVARLFERQHAEEDRAFVKDLIEQGGAAAGAALELLEMVRKLTPEAAQAAAEQIRVDSVEQEAFSAAARAVRGQGLRGGGRNQEGA